MKTAILSLCLLFVFGMISSAQEAPKTNPKQEAPKTIATSPAPNAPAEKPVNPNGPEVSFEETSHDFATLQKGDDCSYEFKFKNTGKEPLIIANCQASCGCTT